MGRIIDTGSTPAKRRRAHQRSCAEVLRLLAEKPVFDSEGKDMLAFLAFNLKAIYKTIDESAAAWDEKNYWKKAEALREKWRWSRTSGEELERLVLAGAWNEVPGFLIGLVSHFGSVRVTAITRDSDWWVGAYRALLKKAQTA